MYNRLKDLADELNIIAGAGTAAPFDIDRTVLENIPFVGYDHDVRLDPTLTMADAKSLIAVGIPYNKAYKKPLDNRLRGCMSSGAVGEDYHITAWKKLNIIADRLLKGYDAMIFSDTGPLIDREVALRCGLGYRGRHYGIINDKIGSMFFIGYIITNMPFENWNIPNTSIKNSCGGCLKCINACPTGALGLNTFDHTKCISYITQKSGTLNDFEARSIQTQIYGCDICQRACPKNKLTLSENEYAYPDIERLLNISNKEFKNIFAPTAAGWRGKKILQRNAVIALGNLKDERALKLLYRLRDDDRIEISQAAKWAINEILNKYNTQ